MTTPKPWLLVLLAPSTAMLSMTAKLPTVHSTKLLIANQATGGTGVTLTAASAAIYYSQGYSMTDRVQSEEYLTGLGTAQVKRAAKATADASPEPVAKGRKLAVTGRRGASTSIGRPAVRRAPRRTG